MNTCYCRSFLTDTYAYLKTPKMEVILELVKTPLLDHQLTDKKSSPT